MVNFASNRKINLREPVKKAKPELKIQSGRKNETKASIFNRRKPGLPGWQWRLKHLRAKLMPTR